MADQKKILAEMGITSGMVLVDTGCRDGFFTIPAAGMVGKKGAVIAVDLYAEFMQRLRDKAIRERPREHPHP